MPTISTQTYSFVKQDYASSLLKQLCKLRKNGEFCDVELVVGEKSFAAHRNVLSACSEYFHAMFTSGLSEVSSKTVDLHGVDADVFELLIQFMYAEDIQVLNANCQDLLVAADMFGIPQIKDFCCDFMRTQIDAVNCIGIYLLAELHSCTELKAVCERYIFTHFLQVINEEEFLNLPGNKIEELLKSENLNIENESQVFEAAMKWLLHDVNKRRQFVFNVLNWVRFPIIPKLQIDQVIDSCTDLSLTIAVQTHLQDFSASRRNRHPGKLRSWKHRLMEPRLSARRHLYVIGGYSRAPGARWSDSKSLGSVEHFDFVKNCWTFVPSMHNRRSSHGAVAHNGLIYVVGGENDSLIYASGECYDPSTNKWTMIPSMTAPRCGLGVCVVDEFIYALGGWVGSEIGNTIEKFDLQTQSWQVCGFLKTLLFGMGVVSYKGCIYVVGGTNDLGTELQSVECYDVDGNIWRSLPDMISPRAYVACVIYGDFLYAVGGWNEHKGALRTAERFSLIKNDWEKLPSMSLSRAGPSICVVHGLIYVIGGRTSSDEFTAPATLDSVECYDPETNSWLEPEMDIMTGRCEAIAVIL